MSIDSQTATAASGPSAQVRPGRDADSDAVIALIDGCYREYAGCVLDVDNEEPQLRQVATFFDSRGGHFWVAELDGVIVGCGGFCPAGAEAQLFNLYLDSRYRGLGLGKSLVRLCSETARELGLKRLSLWTDTRFTRAHRFYESLGFHRGPMLRSLGDRSFSVEYCYRMGLAND